MMIAAVLLAGCLPEDDDAQAPAEGDHLIVHVVSAAQFDSVDVELVDVGGSQLHYQLQAAATTYDYSLWEVLDGSGPRDVKTTALLNDAVVGSGEATHIEYRPLGDGSNQASITMQLSL